MPPPPVKTDRDADLERFAALVEMSQDFIAMADFDGIVTFLNRAGRELVGVQSDEEALGRPTTDYFTEAGHARSQEIEDGVREFGHWEGESELRHFRTGASIPVSVNSFLVTGSDGAPLALATVQRDLRARLATEEALALRVVEQRDLAELGRLALTEPINEVLRAAVRRVQERFPGTRAGVLTVEEGLRLRTVATGDEAWEGRVVEFGPQSIIGTALLEDRIRASIDLPADERFTERERATAEGAHAVLICPIPGRETPWGIVGVACSEVRTWHDDEVAFLESITATLGAAIRRYELEAELQHQAMHDALTGLPNRALALDRISGALGRTARSGRLMGVLLLDIDDFKSVNDLLGHGLGDELLTDLAERLEAVVHPGDTVARLGGDEFVVVCEGLADADEIAFVAEALLGACADPFTLGGHSVNVSMSVGVAVAAAGEAESERLLSEADIAMYRAKRDRRGTYRVFDEAMRGDVLQRIDIAGRLRTAVRSGQIRLEYQPIVDLTTGQVVALEALARWTDPDGMVVSPDVFIPVAEETGLIGDLGWSVLERAGRQMAAWQQAGLALELRVNVSAHELRSATYVERVRDLLGSSGLTPGTLGLEITESALVDDDWRTQDNLTRLSEAGVELIVDDFGTGYSSLSYLERFPIVDVVKIDRSFMHEGARGRAVVRAVVGLARTFDFRVCAEGVETPDQLAYLKDLGCDLAQGFHLARPTPVDDVVALLAGWEHQPPA